MKHIIRIYLIHLFALWLNTYLFAGSFLIGKNIKIFLFSALILTLLNVILKPVLKLLFFPINVLTLGLFSLIINVIIFYLLLYLVPDIKILPWSFAGFSYQQFTVPAYSFNFWPTLFIISTLTSFSTNLLIYLVK